MIGQRKLLQWTVPGIAHALTFWGFIVLLLTILEAYGDLFSPTFAIPVIGHWPVIGFIEDLFAVGVLAGIITFAVIRLRNNPNREGRDSRFSGIAHRRRLARSAGDIPGDRHAAAVPGRADQHRPLPVRPRRVRVADRRPLARAAGNGREQRAGDGVHPRPARRHPRLPGVHHLLQASAHHPGPGERALLPPPERPRRAAADAERAARCSTSRRPTRTPTSSAAARSRTSPGRASSTWRTCTECGRCQSQCPAWVTGKPLSPKMVILDLRDHALAKAPYLLASSDEERDALPEEVKQEAERPLVGDPAAGRRDRPGRDLVVHQLRRLRAGMPG